MFLSDLLLKIFHSLFWSIFVVFVEKYKVIGHKHSLLCNTCVSAKYKNPDSNGG